MLLGKSNDENVILQVKLDEEETSSFRDRLLPLIIGLLRTVSLLPLLVLLKLSPETFYPFL